MLDAKSADAAPMFTAKDAVCPMHAPADHPRIPPARVGILLANLGGSAFLYARFLRGGGGFPRLLNWQTFYLYIFAAWAAVVAFLFPLLFGFA